MSLLIGLIFVVAAASWIVAVWSALAVVSLSPAGQRLRNYFALGWWRFADLEARLGAVVVPHLKRYKLAVLVFLLSVVAGIVIGILSTQPWNA